MSHAWVNPPSQAASVALASSVESVDMVLSTRESSGGIEKLSESSLNKHGILGKLNVPIMLCGSALFSLFCPCLVRRLLRGFQSSMPPKLLDEFPP